MIDYERARSKSEVRTQAIPERQSGRGGCRAEKQPQRPRRTAVAEHIAGGIAACASNEPIPMYIPLASRQKPAKNAKARRAAAALRFVAAATSGQLQRHIGCAPCSCIPFFHASSLDRVADKSNDVQR